MIKGLAVSFLVVFAAAEFLPYEVENTNTQAIDKDWPPIKVEYDFQVDFSFEIWDPTLKKLIPYGNMSGT